MFRMDHESMVRRQRVIYKQPALRIQDYMCLGNGDLGMMLDPLGSQTRSGYIAKCDLWFEQHRYPKDPLQPFYSFKEMQEAFRKGGIEAVTKLVESEGNSVDNNNYDYTVCPRSAGSVQVSLLVEGRELADIAELASDYQQKLDIYDSVCSTHFVWPEHSETNTRAFIHSGKNLIVLKFHDRAEKNQQVLRRINLVRHIWEKAPDREDFVIREEQHKKVLLLEYRNQDGLRATLACKILNWDVTMVKDENKDPKATEEWTDSTSAKYQIRKGNVRLEVGPAPELDIIVLVSLATSKETDNPTSLALDILREAEEEGYDRLEEEHIRWWHSFWTKSFIEVPDKDIEQAWYFQQYLLASSSRAKYAPPLCMLWSFQPEWPWRGCYFDFNHAALYQAVEVTNHPELADPYWRMIKDALPGFRANAQKLFDARGICLPHCWGHDGYEVSTLYWRYQFYHTAWVGIMEYWRYLYSLDQELLEKEVYPFMKEAILFYQDFMEWNEERGCWTMPVPACTINECDNSHCWEKRNDAFDLGCVRRLIKCAIIASEILDCNEALRREWQEFLEKQAPLPTDGIRYLVDESEIPPNGHPGKRLVLDQLGLMFPTGAVKRNDEKAINTLAEPGMQGMGGQCFTGMMWAASAAWMGIGDLAVTALHAQLKRHMFPNGVIGEGTNIFIPEYGRQYPSTLVGESGSYAVAAISEMLCRSLYDGVIRIFPAVPTQGLGAWAPIRFGGLRTMGGFLISAERTPPGHWGKTEVTFIGIESLAGAECRVELPDWPEKELVVEDISGKTVPEVRIEKNIVHFSTQKGKKYLLYRKEKRPQGWLPYWSYRVTPRFSYVGLPKKSS